MRAWLTLLPAALRAMAPEDVAARLAAAQARRHATIELTQLRAWEAQARILREALAGAPEDWRLHLECDLLRLERRVDAVLLTGRAILVLEFKHGARGYAAADLRQTEDYALDLHDFHAGSRAHPLVPVLVATHAPGVPFDPPLIWHGVAPAQRTNAAGLAALIAAMERAIPAPATPIDAAGWIGKPYRPVPSVLEAATLLYRRNAVGEIAEARADAANLTRTADAIARAIAEARRDGARIVVFVTGIPGAGKTLCGLNVVFGALREHGAAFLTGNVPLVTVLREALARNAAPEGGRRLKAERDLARKALQNVHRFLEEHVGLPDHAPDTRIIVFDEAQRAWDEAQATRDTQRRVSRLSMSEPAHTLEIMGRHAGWSVVVALIGGGQEINTGEAGLAQWGRVIEVTGSWRAVAPPSALSAPDPAQRLADGPQALALARCRPRPARAAAQRARRGGRALGGCRAARRGGGGGGHRRGLRRPAHAADTEPGGGAPGPARPRPRTAPHGPRRLGGREAAAGGGARRAGGRGRGLVPLALARHPLLRGVGDLRDGV
jgi:hypothetical protein